MLRLSLLGISFIADLRCFHIASLVDRYGNLAELVELHPEGSTTVAYTTGLSDLFS